MNTGTSTKSSDKATLKKKKRKATLTKIAVIVGILAGIATIVGVLIPILDDDGSDVMAYQQRVLGTCTQVHEILTKEHNEIFEITTGGIRIKKDVLLTVTDSNFRQAKAAFEHLNTEDVPSELSKKHQAAVRAQDAWYAAGRETMDMIRDELPDRATPEELNRLSTRFPTMAANVELNSAMGTLAGKDCQSTG